MSKKVSIIVPAYNAEKYLPLTLKSIINQTYDNLEIIVIDDCSTDKTKEIISDFSKKDSRIIPYYSEINQGVSKTRNIGLKTFSGDYVLFVDADDVLAKDCIEIQVNTAEKYDGDIIDSLHLVVYEDKKKKYYFTEGKVPKNIMVMGSLEDNMDILFKATYITGKIMKKDLVEGVLFDESLRRYEDMVFEQTIKSKCKNYIFLNDVIYYYVQVSSSLTNTLGEKHSCYLDAAKEVINIYKDRNKKIRDKVEAQLFTNAFLTGFTKVVKNDDKSLEDNTKLFMDYLKRFDDVFKTWKTNKSINNIMRKMVLKFQNNYDKSYKFIKKTIKKDFIKMYFKLFSIRYKYNKTK